jgi:trehalose 6-phosphate phosphatase
MIGGELRTALDDIARSSGLVVASDYDGTLSPITDDPAAARPDRAGLDALVALSRLPTVRCLIVSGRSPDVLADLTGEPVGVTLIGNHGAGYSPDTQPDGAATLAPQQLASLLAEAEGIASAHPGSFVEEKPFGVALHYRGAADGATIATLGEEAGRRAGGRIIHGKQVVEIVLAHGDKGTAVETFRTQHGCERIVFFGDDTTDEDVFTSLSSADVGVKVGSGPTAARFRVADPASVAEALSALVIFVRSANE